MTEREVVKKILEAMLEHDIVPVFIEGEATAEGWIIQGDAMSSVDSDYRYAFRGAAFRDGSFSIESGAFGKLTDEGLDVFDGLGTSGKPVDLSTTPEFAIEETRRGSQ